MLTKLRRIDKPSENFNNRLKKHKKAQSELKNTVTEMKKDTIGNQKQVRKCGRMDLQSGRQGNGNQPR